MTRDVMTLNVNSNSDCRSTVPPIAMSDFQSNRAFTPSNTQNLCSGIHYRYSLPPPIMPGEQTRILWCLDDPDHAPAPVRVPESADIDYLKEVIKEKFGLHDVSTSRLVVWKVRIYR